MKTILKVNALLAVAFTLFLATSCQNAETPKESKEVAEQKNEEKFDTRDTERDAQLVVDLVANQYKEIRLSKYAIKKSTNAEIKSTSGMLVKDHTALLGDLKSLAAKKNISVPNEDSTEANKFIDDWKDDKVEDFNKDFLDKMETSHKNTVDKMQGALDNSDTDVDIKNAINAALPTVRKHLEMIIELKGKFDKKS